MCRHTNYPSPGPHTGTLQWLKLLQHAAFSVMKHEPGAALALGFPRAGSRALHAPAPHPQPPSGKSCLTFPSCSLCLGAGWHPGQGPGVVAPRGGPDLPLASPSCCSECPSPRYLWKPTSLGWEKWFGFVGFVVFFLHGRLFGVEIKG